LVAPTRLNGFLQLSTLIRIKGGHAGWPTIGTS
jgi:hypothetical protein